jgi:hypothetical protein
LGILKSLKDIRESSSEQIVYIVAIIGPALLMVSIIAEMKFSIYHLSRLYIFLSILTGAGFISLWQIIKNRSKNFVINAILISIILGFALLSPLPRLLLLWMPVYYKCTNTYLYDKYYEESAIWANERLTYKEIASYINNNSKEGDRIELIALSANTINYLLEGRVVSKFPHSLFYFSPAASDIWKQEFESELYNADWLIVHTNDENVLLSGYNGTSYQNFFSKYEDYTVNNFELKRRIHSFLIYKRIDERK